MNIWTKLAMYSFYETERLYFRPFFFSGGFLKIINPHKKKLSGRSLFILRTMTNQLIIQGAKLESSTTNI